MDVLSTFQQMVKSLFQDPEFMHVDIINDVIGSTSHGEHIGHPIVVYERIGENFVMLKIKKCGFGVAHLNLLEHVVSGNGVDPDPVKERCVLQARLPQLKRELRSFWTFRSINTKSVRGFWHTFALMHAIDALEVEFRCTK